MEPITNTCALYGASTYSNNWLGVNVVVILISLLAVAIVYSISYILPIVTKEKLHGAARTELVQAFVSCIILVILLGSATVACNISSSMSNAYIGKKMDPFAFATYYIGNLSINTGVNLISNIYATSVAYSIEGSQYSALGGITGGKISKLDQFIRKFFKASSPIQFSVAVSLQFGSVFVALSGLYVTIFGPLVTVAVGLLFLQFVALPFLQYTAFVVILPIALAMRSLAFLGNNLRFAANAVLAIAIAGYIVYPVAIAFNTYAIGWIFSSSNPSFKYVQSNTYVVPGITPSSFFKGTQSADTGAFGEMINNVYPIVSSSFNLSTNGHGPLYNVVALPFTIIQQSRAMINRIAQFLFTAVIMIIIDVAITIGFAMGLTKALNSGIEGAGSFWTGI